ncbi:hypothetical protein IPA_07480 [Ignicoccus pacificus DSM 13166]|uniref:Uncharacterized protein n=1 Tax=Ignicoccus pacificus DSM 13166 TaxID=940294 RepID=A0A977KBR7_9CREN|nr:hypothetical protein IPA_07480 [Ignicoccus pacificus DSM 13166]
MKVNALLALSFIAKSADSNRSKELKIIATTPTSKLVGMEESKTQRKSLPMGSVPRG